MQHPKICEIPSMLFYDKELETTYSSGNKIVGFWPKGPDCPLVFCDVQGEESAGTFGSKRSGAFSKTNCIEADKVVCVHASALSKVFVYCHALFLHNSSIKY